MEPSILRQQIIAAVRNKLGFENYETTDLVLTIPSIETHVYVKRAYSVKGSAYNGIKELALIGGYMIDNNEVKALVIYLERPTDVNNIHDFDFVTPDRIKRIKIVD